MNMTGSRFHPKLTESIKSKKDKNSLKIPTEKLYKTLNRQDFDITVKKYWCEYRVRHPPVRRTRCLAIIVWHSSLLERLKEIASVLSMMQSSKPMQRKKRYIFYTYFVLYL